MANSVHHSPLALNPEIEENQNISWWKRRTKLEKLLCLSTIIALLILCVVTVTLASTTRKSNDVCLTTGCIKAASAVLDMIDEKIDPCENFYQFACGGYFEKNEIPDDKSDKALYSDLDYKTYLTIKGLLKKPLDGSEPKYVKMIKDMYDSCMDLKTIEEANSEPLLKVLASLGGWPVVEGDSWDGSQFNWLETLISIRRLGYDHGTLLELSVGGDLRNNKIHVVTLDQASLGMPGRAYLLKGLSDPATAAYFKLMVQAANKLGANKATSERELMDALNFEISLADYSLPDEKRRNISSAYNKYTFRKLQKLVPQVDWLKYFNSLLNDPVSDGETGSLQKYLRRLLSNPVSDSETVIVFVPEFVKKVGELLATTDKRTIANYMIWRVVKSSLPYLSKEWRELDRDYKSAVSGESTELPRWEQCINSLYSNLGIALSSYYVQNFFQEENKEKALEVVNYIRQAFLNILESIDWMGKNTKAQAKDKAKGMISFIGYPQEILDETLVLELYGNVTITNDDYFNNQRSLNKQKTDNVFNKLRKPRIRGDWRDHAMSAAVGASHPFWENTIDVSAAFLQNPLFDKDRPYYMNFGASGYVIGHEITHGFDDVGRQFDKIGNNKNWWDETTEEKFKEKAKCMIYQYGNYTSEIGLQLNGILTLGENIADNGGLKEAYLAYQSWAQDHGAEQKLPGLKYTPSQLFWISAAHIRCTKFRPELLKQLILSDPHSPTKFRVIGPMSNIPEFSIDFQCPLGSLMNPRKKCKVW